jgi:hypothetical protein
MLGTDLMLAQDGVFVMEWYSWVGIVGIIVVLIAYKIYKDKTMT